MEFNSSPTITHLPPVPEIAEGKEVSASLIHSVLTCRFQRAEMETDFRQERPRGIHSLAANHYCEFPPCPPA